MAKVPRPGRVKTRLGRDIGAVAAAWWYRHQVDCLIRRIQDPRWHLVLAVTPDGDGMTTRAWPPHLSRVPQGPGDLGTRMARLLQGSVGPTLIIGSDIPGVGRQHLARAFRELRGRDAVIGPAYDGGYWLIGTRGRGVLRQGALEGVRWSTADALSDTVQSLAGLRIGWCDKMRDVDTMADLAIK